MDAGCGFLGLYKKKYGCLLGKSENFVSLFVFAVFSNALIDTLSAFSQ